jgi:hypothetical protein
LINDGFLKQNIFSELLLGLTVIQEFQNPGIMVRTQDQGPRVVVFERREKDGKTHAPWVLRSEVSGTNEKSALKVHLHYGGSLFDGGIVERVLADQIEQGKAKLTQFLAG